MADTVKDLYDEALKKQGDALNKAYSNGLGLYGGIRSAGDNAYQELDRQARIDKAMQDRVTASGDRTAGITAKAAPATTSLRSANNLRNTLGKNERQHENYERNVDLALGKLQTQNNEDRIRYSAQNASDKAAAQVSQSNFDNEYNLKKNEQDFSEAYTLFMNRKIGPKGFKDMTGIAVKALPKPKVIHKPITIKYDPNHPVTDKNYTLIQNPNDTSDQYYVLNTYQQAANNTGTPLFADGKMKSDEQINKDLGIGISAPVILEGTKEAEAAAKDSSYTYAPPSITGGKGMYVNSDVYYLCLSKGTKPWNADSSPKSTEDLMEEIYGTDDKGKNFSYDTLSDNLKNNGSDIPKMFGYDDFSTVKSYSDIAGKIQETGNGESNDLEVLKDLTFNRETKMRQLGEKGYKDAVSKAYDKIAGDIQSTINRAVTYYNLYDNKISDGNLSDPLLQAGGTDKVNEAIKSLQYSQDKNYYLNPDDTTTIAKALKCIYSLPENVRENLDAATAMEFSSIFDIADVYGDEVYGKLGDLVSQEQKTDDTGNVMGMDEGIGINYANASNMQYDTDKRQEAQKKAQKLFGVTSDCTSPVNITIGGKTIDTRIDLTTGLLKDNGNQDIKDLNDDISFIMMQKSFGQALDEDKLKEIGSYGINILNTVIDNQQTGDYFKATDNAKNDIIKPSLDTIYCGMGKENPELLVDPDQYAQSGTGYKKSIPDNPTAKDVADIAGVVKSNIAKYQDISNIQKQIDYIESQKSSTDNANIIQSLNDAENLLTTQLHDYDDMTINDAEKRKDTVKGQQLAADSNKTIADDQAKKIGLIDNYIYDTANDPNKKAAAEQQAQAYAQSVGATDYKNIPISIPGDMAYTFDATTGLISTDGAPPDRAVYLNKINDATSMLMMEKSLGVELDSDNLNYLKQQGVQEVLNLINTKQPGDYFVMTDNAKKTMIDSFLNTADQETYKTQQAQKKSDTETTAMSKPDFNTVVQNTAKQNVSIPFNPIFEKNAPKEVVHYINAVDWTAPYQYSKAFGSVPAYKENYTQIDRQIAETGVGTEYRYLKDTERNTLLYLYGSNQLNKFKEYQQYLEPILRTRQNESEQQAVGKWVEEPGPIGEIMSGAAAIGNEMVTPAAYIETLYDAVTGQRVDTTTFTQMAGSNADYYKNLASSTTKNPVGKWLINTSISMAPQLLAFAGGEIPGILYAATSTAGVDASNQIKLGASPLQAAIHSTVSGLITAATTKAMLNGLGDIMRGTPSPMALADQLDNFATNGIRAFGVGMSTGTVNSIANKISDMIISGDKSEFAAIVNQYQQQGMSEQDARSTALVQYLVLDSLEKGSENGVMAGVMSIPGTARANSIQNSIVPAGESYTGIETDPFKGTDFSPLDDYIARQEGGTKTPQLGKGFEPLKLPERVYTPDDVANAVKAVQNLPKGSLPDAEYNGVMNNYYRYGLTPTSENALMVIDSVNESLEKAGASTENPVIDSGTGLGDNKKVGNRETKFDFREVFFKVNPKLRGKVVVHHSIEQQVLKNYPNIFSEEEINKYERLRGIPNEKNGEIHLSEIRRIWNQFYKDIMKGKIQLTKENFIKKANEIDDLYGRLFNPKIR